MENFDSSFTSRNLHWSKCDADLARQLQLNRKMDLFSEFNYSNPHYVSACARQRPFSTVVMPTASASDTALALAPAPSSLPPPVPSPARAPPSGQAQAESCSGVQQITRSTQRMQVADGRRKS